MNQLIDTIISTLKLYEKKGYVVSELIKELLKLKK